MTPPPLPLPRYNRTNSVPREVLASVVDDFNSGDPNLVRREWFGAISLSMINDSVPHCIFNKYII